MMQMKPQNTPIFKSGALADFWIACMAEADQNHMKNTLKIDAW